MSVSIHPGAIAFTWMPCGASSMAIDFVSCTIAPFAVLYDGTRPAPKYEYMLPMLMILPRLRVAIDAAASFDSRNTAFSCVSITASQDSAVSCRMPPVTLAMPALLTRMSTGPSSASTRRNAGSSAGRSVTSTASASARAPAACSSASTSAFFSTLRPKIATAAPACANPSAMPRPMPRLPPVTRATRPARSNAAGAVIANLTRLRDLLFSRPAARGTRRAETGRPRPSCGPAPRP